MAACLKPYLRRALLGAALPVLGAVHAEEPPARQPVAQALESLPAGGSTVQATVIGGDDDDFLPADELDVPLPSGPRPVPGEPVAAAPRRSWGVAPVRWGGELSAGFRRRGSDVAGDTNEQLYEARLRASSYVMQPYIALIGGDVALTLLRSRSAGDGSVASHNLSGTSLTGTGTLAVFPQSRFPFNASISASDSRSDGSLTTSNVARRRLSLRQDYRPEIGDWNAYANYDRSVLTGDFGRDTVDRLAGGFAATRGDHRFDANGSLSRNTSREGVTRDRIALGRHSWRYSDALNVETTASYTGQEFDLEGDQFSVTGEVSSMQLFSFASWTPVDSKWRGTGNLRYFQTRTGLGESGSESRNFGGGASLAYQASRNLSVYGAVNANLATGTGVRDTSTSQSVGLNYSSDPRMFGEYAYTWYGAASLSNATSSEGAAQRSAGASAGHSVQRMWRLSDISLVNGTVSQAVSTTRSTGLGSASSSAINHSLSVNLQAMPSETVSGFIGLNASDTRNMGDDTSSFQLVNVQLSGRWRINAVSELSSNLTWQLTRQDSGRRDDFLSGSSGSTNSSLSGNLSYAHSRAFGVRGLYYTADFRANSYQSYTRRDGNPDADRERATLDLDQRLRYRIGRLDTELQARVAKIEGRQESLIFLKVTREFGAY